ncbi:glycosyltransferase [Acidihalobacter prosperus]|uniref:Glycosyl transferase, group 1 family protein n=1 Tax=Acidihalobacter prosperus TaxID=160660 RepID=A0A1A6C605_9GAMM|nr:glycosyltransferase [Acidihalobacter prosperus]OBS09992.1 glycosyl transferase, group 1 family protein [Acidihalobacter prosperus]
MRIVLDLQGAQTESRFRGIGRYSLSLAKAIARNRGEHEVIVALNGLFHETIEPVRAAFEGILPQENVRVWEVPGPTRATNPNNRQRRQVAERIREAFFASLDPDVVLITSLFEGYGDDAVTSVGELDGNTPVAVVLYDLIPLINPDENYKSNDILREHYSRKIQSLKRSQQLLAISESARQEAIDAVGFDEHRVVNVSGAFDPSFHRLNLSEQEKGEVCRRVGITREFVMYTGGADDRKNLRRLIQAYAELPDGLRDIHQLVLAGKMPEGHAKDLLKTAKSCGLTDEEVVLTGYVEDDDLLKLYNSCALFVFPSLHEGFGLPPLEAMACGAPVIASNATSLPEVVGYEDALFDPCSVSSISRKMEQGLVDEDFRASLAAHAKSQIGKFSWDESAKRALRAVRVFDRGSSVKGLAPVNVQKTSKFLQNNKKILVIKLDHMGDLLLAVPAITKLRARYPYATIDAVVGSWNASIAEQIKVFDNLFFLDFFKKKSAESPSAKDSEIGEFLDRLGEYDIAIDLRRQRDTRFLLAKVKAKHKAGYQTFDPDIDDKLDVVLPSYPDIPFETTPLNRTSITVQMLRIIDALPEDINDYVSLPALAERRKDDSSAVAIFPHAGNDVKEWGRENYRGLIELLDQDARIEAINVYFASDDEARRFGLGSDGKITIHAGLEFSDLVQSLARNAICVANNSLGVHLAGYLDLIVLGVYAGHETVAEWAPVFGDSYVVHESVSCSPCHIASRSDCQHEMRCLANISVEFVYNKVMEAVSSLRDDRDASGSGAIQTSVSSAKSPDEIVTELLNSLADCGGGDFTDADKGRIARCVASNIVPVGQNRQLFVDVSALVHVDAKSGIQRVVRSVLGYLLNNEPSGYDVIPVYANADRLGYFRANAFSSSFLGEPAVGGLRDDAISFYPGDVFLGLDLHPHVVSAQRETLEQMRRHGVLIKFVVYDLLCVLMPHFFDDALVTAFRQWLEVVAASDEAVCISKAVADELTDWVDRNDPKRSRPLRISWFHLGADIENSSPSRGLPPDAEEVLRTATGRVNFLMVGTLEPRKGHAQALAAFEVLWEEGSTANLIIVGKEGWKTGELAERLRSHPEMNKRLFWLEGISDEYLERIYAASTCLIAASEGEGFGLPLIEAAQRHLPIIARDIPVFREVAGKHAYYFEGREPEALAKSVNQWLGLYDSNTYPQSSDIPWMTWSQSVEQLLSIILPVNQTVAMK